MFAVAQVLSAGVTIPISLIWIDTDRWILWVILGVCVYLVSFALHWTLRAAERHTNTSVEQAVATERRTTTEELCYAFTGVPESSIEFFEQLRAGDDRARKHLDRYLSDMLEHVIKVVEARDVRACLYFADGRDSQVADAARVQITSLTLAGNGHGRPDAPRPGFDGDEPHVKFIIQCLNERRTIFVEDTANPPDGVVISCDNKRYKSFLAAPVVYGADEYGMLMLDSPEVRGLTREHEVIAELFASFIGSGFHLVQSSPAGSPRLSPPDVRVASNEQGGAEDGKRA